MEPTPRAPRVALFASPAAEHHLARALASRGAVVDRVVTSTEAIDALLHGRDQVLVTDCVVPGVVLVMHAWHLVAGPPAPSSFEDELVECMESPVDPIVLAAAVARAARRLVWIPPAAGDGTEAA